MNLAINGSLEGLPLSTPKFKYASGAAWCPTSAFGSSLSMIECALDPRQEIVNGAIRHVDQHRFPLEGVDSSLGCEALERVRWKQVIYEICLKEHRKVRLYVDIMLIDTRMLLTPY